MPVEDDADIAGFFDAGDFGVVATWQAGGTGSPVSVTVILEAPDALASIATVPEVAPDARIRLPVSAVANIAAGDRFTIGAASYEVLAPMQDTARVTWMLPARRLDAATTGSTALQGLL